MSVCVVSLDYLCRWQVQGSVYCSKQIHAQIRYTQCVLLHLIDIFFLPCICLFAADIANPFLLACDCLTWISLDIAQFYLDQCQPSSGSV